jgi:hypothetical protein
MKGYLDSDRRFFRRMGIGLLGLAVWAACLSCGGDARPPEASAVPESFSFFDIGANTQLTDGLRSTLREKLGRVSVSGRNVLNLAINYNGFLKEHFPALEALNRQLNGSAGIRVEHDTVTLMYRHMKHQNTPFDFVELVFDGQTRKPLVIRIRSDREGADILETLKRRYQEPRSIAWGDGSSRAYHWEKNGDVLILSVTPNPVGRPVYNISMYYVNSIQALIKREKEEGREERQEEESAVKDAFSRRPTSPGAPDSPAAPGFIGPATPTPPRV